MGDIHQTAGEISGIGGLERGVGQPFAASVSGNKVFKDRQALAEVGNNRLFDNFTDASG